MNERQIHNDIRLKYFQRMQTMDDNRVAQARAYGNDSWQGHTMKSNTNRANVTVIIITKKLEHFVYLQSNMKRILQ